MTDLEITQPEETPESVDAVDETVEVQDAADADQAVEAQALDDATSDPGAVVEETQTFEQAEAVESALGDAVEAAEQTEGTPVPIPTPEPGEEDGDDMQLISGPSRDDLPDGTGILEEPHETVAIAEELGEPGPTSVAEVPEGMEFQLAGEGDDDGKDEVTPINLPGPVAEEDDDDMQLISGPSRDDLPDGTGILEEPHETVAIAEELGEPGPASVAEVPEGMEFQLAGEGDDDDKDEATPINLPGPVAEDDDDMQLISGPSRDDLPDGTGILEEPHQTVEMAEKPGDPSPACVAEVPEGMEFQLAGDGTVDRDDPGTADPSGLSETSGEGDGDGSKDATPINLPGPVPAQVAIDPDDPPPPPDMSGQTQLSPDDVKVEASGRGGADEVGGVLPVPIPKPTMEEDDSGSYVALDHTGPGGNVVDEPDHGPNPITQVALDHTGPGDNVAENPDDPPPPPDLTSQRELTPDDVKQGETLQPAPDFEDMNTSERSVVEIIGKAIADEEYRGTLLSDARSAVAGYTVTDDDQTALGEMTEEAFDFFAAEVEKRFSQAKETLSEELLSDAHQQLMQQVVHAVWRDLNPGGLAYVLAYKIPQKHLS